MSRPGGFESLDLCAHLVNHTSNPRLRNIEFYTIDITLLDDKPEAENALRLLREESERQGCIWKFVVIMVASRKIKKGEQLQTDYNLKNPFSE